jgi:hypothetical protein
MSEHRLSVVREPEEMDFSVGLLPAVPEKRCAQDVYLCGLCGIILARYMPWDEVRDTVLFCPNCGAGNRSTGDEPDDYLPGA